MITRLSRIVGNVARSSICAVINPRLLTYFHKNYTMEKFYVQAFIVLFPGMTCYPGLIHMQIQIPIHVRQVQDHQIPL